MAQFHAFAVKTAVQSHTHNRKPHGADATLSKLELMKGQCQHSIQWHDLLLNTLRMEEEGWTF